MFSVQLKNAPDPDALVDYLRKWRGSLSYREIDEKLGYEGDCASHWFTYPKSKHGFSFPSPKDWIRLKELLSFDSQFDVAMTETILVSQQIQAHPRGRNPSDFWSVNTKPFKGAHFTVYPEDICEKPIKSSCPQNGIVLDPMCGSGTTCVVAKKLGRKYIGIELNPEYVEIAKKRLSQIPEKLSSFFTVKHRG